jgi:hypothetical protein
VAGKGLVVGLCCSSIFSFLWSLNQFVWSFKGFGRSRQDLEIRNQNILPQAGDVSSQSIFTVIIQVF